MKLKSVTLRVGGRVAARGSVQIFWWWGRFY